jgi:hypothetical protein
MLRPSGDPAERDQLGLTPHEGHRTASADRSGSELKNR